MANAKLNAEDVAHQLSELGLALMRASKEFRRFGLTMEQAAEAMTSLKSAFKTLEQVEEVLKNE